MTSTTTKKIVIMSGVPGSGKSTYIKSLEGRLVVCSADHYFMDEKGNYNFDFTKLRLAHGECLRKFMAYRVNRCLTSPRPPFGACWCWDYLVVDNTNTTALEIAPYYAVASAYEEEVDIELVTVLCDPVKAHTRNTHGVPLQGVLAMDQRIRSRELPPFWNIKQTVVEH